MKRIWQALAIVAAIAVVTAHWWHIGTLACCLVMVAASKEEKEKAGRR